MYHFVEQCLLTFSLRYIVKLTHLNRKAYRLIATEQPLPNTPTAKLPQLGTRLAHQQFGLWQYVFEVGSIELMMRLNAVGGWQITVSSRTGQYQVRQQAAEAQYLLMLLTTKDGKHYISVVNPSFRKFIERQASQSSQVTTCQWVVSRDTRYATWPKTRSLRGRRITEVEYLQIIHNS